MSKYITKLMDEYLFARLVISKSGHDKGKLYIIINSDSDFVYLADGTSKKLENLKKKNKKHIQLTNFVSEELIKKNKKNKLHNEDVRKVIQKYKKEHFHFS